MGKKIEVVRGTSRTLRLNIKDANGFPYTLSSGEKLLFGVKKDEDDSELLILKTITECTNGVAQIKLLPSDTIDLVCDRYIYDVNLESGEDFIPVIKVNPFVVKKNVTKRGDGS